MVNVWESLVKITWSESPFEGISLSYLSDPLRNDLVEVMLSLEFDWQDGNPMKTSEVMSQINLFLKSLEDVKRAKKHLILFDFYHRNKDKLSSCEVECTTAIDTLHKHIISNFSSKDENNPVRHMFEQKMAYLVSTKKHINYLNKDVVSDVAEKELRSYVNSFMHNRSVLNQACINLEELWVDPSFHSLFSKVATISNELKKTEDEFSAKIESYLNPIAAIENNFIPYVIQPSLSIDRDLYNLLGLDKPSALVAKIGQMQLDLGQSKDANTRKELFSAIQQTYIDLYYTVFCVYNPWVKKTDKDNFVLSPENPAYQQAMVLRDILHDVYQKADSIHFDMSPKTWFLGSIVDKNKKIREEIIATCKKYYPHYSFLCDVIEQHNNWIKKINGKPDNQRVFEQTRHATYPQLFNTTTAHYSVPVLDSPIHDFFKTIGD